MSKQCMRKAAKWLKTAVDFISSESSTLKPGRDTSIYVYVCVCVYIYIYVYRYTFFFFWWGGGASVACESSQARDVAAAVTTPDP